MREILVRVNATGGVELVDDKVRARPWGLFLCRHWMLHS
jgi:hypothetical protein